MCFDEGVSRIADELDPRRRALVATLSEKDYPRLAFVSFGLPASAADRKRWLGLGATTVMEKTVELADGTTMPLFERLSALRGVPTPDTLELAREAVLAEVNRLRGRERLEALALLAMGVHGLHSVVRIDDVYAALDDDAGSWARDKLPELMEDEPIKLRNTGVGMALVWVATREDDAIPEQFDQLITFKAEPKVIREVLERLPSERRTQAIVGALSPSLRSPWNGHIVLEKLLQVSDLVTARSVVELAREIADKVAGDSFLASRSPDEAEALRQRIRTQLVATTP